jgi:hypothetical protein
VTLGDLRHFGNRSFSLRLAETWELLNRLAFGDDSIALRSSTEKMNSRMAAAPW